MAITKETSYDYEVVGDTSIQVRQQDKYIENGVTLSSSYSRHVVHPDSDWSSEPTKIKVICDTFFTDEIKTAWAEKTAAERPST